MLLHGMHSRKQPQACKFDDRYDDPIASEGFHLHEYDCDCAHNFDPLSRAAKSVIGIPLMSFLLHATYLPIDAKLQMCAAWLTICQAS